MVKKSEERRKLPLIAKLIGIFYILFALFYLLTGVIISGIVLGFTSIMAVSSTPFSQVVVQSGLVAASYLINDFFPVWSIIYSGGYIWVIGLLAFASGILVSLVCIGFFKRMNWVGFFKRMNWARFIIIGISLFEFFVVGTIYFLRGGFLDTAAHWIMHGFIIVYLLLSYRVRRAFSD